jgi:multidrug efflux pump subunit AcrA (membrane-fusion protein)
MIKRISIFAVGICFLVGCGSKDKDADEKKEGSGPRAVQLGEVKQATMERVISVDGILRALDQSAVTPKISAPVSKFTVNRGDHVKAGQLLAILESRDLTASVADTKGAFDQAAAALRNTQSAAVPDEVVKAQTDVISAKEAMDAANKVLKSRQDLLAQGAIARKSVDDANLTYVQAKSAHDAAQKHLESVETVARHEEVKVAEGNLDSAKGKYENAQAQLSYAQITSPISGVVADRSIFPGEMAVPGTPLMTIMDISSVIARVNVPQTQAGLVRIGQTGHIIAADGTQADGTVTVISPALDPQGTTVEVWVQAANPGEKLRPGGTVHVTIQGDPIQNAVVVPAAALLPSSEGGSAVFVVGNDMVAKEHKVSVGVRKADVAQVLEGVDPGAKVVVAGGLGLADGAKVQLEGAKSEGKEAKDDKKDGKKEKE